MPRKTSKDGPKKRRREGGTGKRKDGRVTKASTAVRATVDASAAAEAGGPPPQSLLDDAIDVLRRASPFPPDPITPCMDLRQELGLTDDMKRGLSDSLQAIVREFNPAARVSDDECADLETVEDVQVLVATKAGFTLEKECE